MNKIPDKIRSALRELLHRLTGEITTDKQFFCTITVIAVFTALNMYLSYKAIYNKGRWDTEKEMMNIHHLAVPELHYNTPKEFIDSEIPHWFPADSIDNFNKSMYDKQQRKATATA